MDCDILYKTVMPIRFEGYTDADWAGYKADRRSTSGFPRQRSHILEQQEATDRRSIEHRGGIQGRGSSLM